MKIYLAGNNAIPAKDRGGITAYLNTGFYRILKFNPEDFATRNGVG